MASEMIGEILKLAMVVLLVSVVSMGIYNLLPQERVPYVEVQINFNKTNPEFIDITHIGGDPVRTDELTIELTNPENIQDKKDYKMNEITNYDYWKFPQALHVQAQTNLHSHLKEIKVTIIHKRTIITSAEVKKT